MGPGRRLWKPHRADGFICAPNCLFVDGPAHLFPFLFIGQRFPVCSLRLEQAVSGMLVHDVPEMRVEARVTTRGQAVKKVNRAEGPDCPGAEDGKVRGLLAFRARARLGVDEDLIRFEPALVWLVFHRTILSSGSFVNTVCKPRSSCSLCIQAHREVFDDHLVERDVEDAPGRGILIVLCNGLWVAGIPDGGYNLGERGVPCDVSGSKGMHNGCCDLLQPTCSSVVARQRQSLLLGGKVQEPVSSVVDRLPELLRRSDRPSRAVGEGDKVAWRNQKRFIGEGSRCPCRQSIASRPSPFRASRGPPARRATQIGSP